MANEMAKETARVEAFSDGVFAIAVTLLILEIRLPSSIPPGQLGAELLRVWPSYVGYVVSFVTILVMWLNHHRLFRLVRGTDDRMLIANGLLLLSITFVPFPTLVLAEHLKGPDARTAVLFYSGTFVAISLFFNLFWLSVAHRDRLVDPERDGAAIRAVWRSYPLGPVLYGICALLALINPLLSLLGNFAMAASYALPRSPWPGHGPAKAHRKGSNS